MTHLLLNSRMILHCQLSYVSLVFFFFFFQAEDGIRDKLVTGVQTCALPICARQVLCMLGARIQCHQSNAKVTEQDLAVTSHQQVLWLDVAMDHVLLMGIL